MALDDQGKYEEAIQCYDKAIELNPNYSLYYHKKGYALDNLGKYEEAIQCSNKATQLEADPNAYNKKEDAIKALNQKSTGSK